MTALIRFIPSTLGPETALLNGVPDRYLTIGLPRVASTVPHVRHLVVNLLERWDVPSDTGGDVELVLAELVGNAVRHTDGLVVRLDIARLRSHVVVAVADGGPRRQSLPFTGGEMWESGGRGLWIVSHLSQRSGHVAAGISTIAWAVLAW